MLISTKGRYALHIVIDLAEHIPDGYIPLSDIAERQDISKKYLEAIIKDLLAGKIVKAHRGKGGGYKLNIDPAKCSAWDVISACESNLISVSCTSKSDFDCPKRAECRTMPMWIELDKTLKSFFEKYTIADILNGSF